MVEHLGKVDDLMWPYPEELEGELQETVSSLAVKNVSLIYTIADTEWELYMLNKWRIAII